MRRKRKKRGAAKERKNKLESYKLRSAANETRDKYKLEK